MGSFDINIEISRLINYGLQRGLIERADMFYASNRILAKLGIGEFKPCQVTESLECPTEPLEAICDFAVEQKIIEDDQDMRDMFDTEIMDCIMPRPGQVVGDFYRLYNLDKRSATEYYYELSKSSNYIRTDRIEKDRKWTVNTRYGELVITINLSKPEKDPKAIAAAKNAVQSGYPKCALCRENEGFKGSINQAARANHRLIPFELCDEEWFLQYSPYVYYKEHCILISSEHKPMKVNRNSLKRLLEFGRLLPHYFVGSNADLPIVGGSILSHDHFQGGNYEFPMAKANLRHEISFEGYGEIRAGILDWPMSVIRICSRDDEKLLDLADNILRSWREYSDEAVDIHAYTGETPHNTITPIARRRGEEFEMDLVLRNNRSTEEHPLGLFHPHSQYHNIKKENIGLIEVMGLAILPPRLVTEMDNMKKALLYQNCSEEILTLPDMEKHRDWYGQLSQLSFSDEADMDRAIQDSIGEIFMHILENSGVFKDTAQGSRAFLRFCSQVKNVD